MIGMVEVRGAWSLDFDLKYVPYQFLCYFVLDWARQILLQIDLNKFYMSSYVTEVRN